MHHTMHHIMHHTMYHTMHHNSQSDPNPNLLYRREHRYHPAQVVVDDSFFLSLNLLVLLLLLSPSSSFNLSNVPSRPSPSSVSFFLAQVVVDDSKVLDDMFETLSDSTGDPVAGVGNVPASPELSEVMSLMRDASSSSDAKTQLERAVSDSLDAKNDSSLVDAITEYINQVVSSYKHFDKPHSI
jgi:hypothetical protein